MQQMQIAINLMQLGLLTINANYFQFAKLISPSVVEINLIDGTSLQLDTEQSEKFISFFKAAEAQQPIMKTIGIYFLNFLLIPAWEWNGDESLSLHFPADEAILHPADAKVFDDWVKTITGQNRVQLVQQMPRAVT